MKFIAKALPKETYIPCIFGTFNWTIFFHLFQHVVCNRDKILTALVTSDSIIIWYVKPCVPIISHRRSPASIQELGRNVLAQWRPDSSMIVVIVSTFYITISTSKSVRPFVVESVSYTSSFYRVHNSRCLMTLIKPLLQLGYFGKTGIPYSKFML